MFKKTFLTLIVTALLFSCNNGGTLTSSAVISPDYATSISSDRPLKVNTMNFAQVNRNIYRGGVPNEDDIIALKKVFKVKTLISFRGMATTFNENVQVAEEKAISDQLKLKFINLPVPFDRRIPEKMVNKFLDIVENSNNWPVYAHCTHGRDRTGTMIALYRIKNDMISGQQALKEMETFGFKPYNYPIFARQVLDSTPFKLAF